MTAQEKGAQDAQDVAWVEAAQKVHPPVQPLDPQPVNPKVRGFYNMTANDCEFRPASRQDGEPIFIAGKVKAVMRVENQPVVFAADTGSPELAKGVHRNYAARAFWAELSGDPATLTVHDRWDRVVYASAGTLTCHRGGITR
jgi:hypothetical protein